MELLKKCTICKDKKDFPEAFYADRQKYKPYCKTCDNAARMKRYYRQDEFAKRALYLNQRAKDGNHIFASQLQELINRSRYICHYCKCTLNDEFTFDHAEPLALGGENIIDNIRVCCLSCNSSKGAKTEDEFKLYLKERPF